MGDVNKKDVLKIDIREVDGIPKKGKKVDVKTKSGLKLERCETQDALRDV